MLASSAEAASSLSSTTTTSSRWIGYVCAPICRSASSTNMWRLQEASTTTETLGHGAYEESVKERGSGGSADWPVMPPAVGADAILPVVARVLHSSGNGRPKQT